MKGHALIHSGKWEGHYFFRKKFPDPPLPPIKNVPSLMIYFVPFLNISLTRQIFVIACISLGSVFYQFFL